MANTRPKTSTLTLEQLLKRWPDYSTENILEWANNGHFGIYVKPFVTRKRSHNIQHHLISLKRQTNKLLTDKSPVIDECEKINYLDKEKKFFDFAKTHPYLFSEKQSYERLATEIEVKTFPSCEPSSILRMRETNKVHFLPYGNHFGFIKKDNDYTSNAYFLREEAHSTYKPPKNYKGYFSEDDLVFFTEQIEAFEKKMQISQVENDYKSGNESENNNPKIELNNELYENIKVGEKVRKNMKTFSKKYGEERKHDANERKKPILADAYEIAKKKPGEYSASSLARRLISENMHDSYTHRTLRMAIGEDKKIKSILK